MRHINIHDNFPIPERRVEKGWKTEENKKIAKKYGKEFFDGDRVNGYGGYYYDGRWKGVVKKMQELYGIDKGSAVLDIGCAKGFLLFDLQSMIPGIHVAGLDISEYALNHAMDRYGEYIVKKNNSGNAKQLEELARSKVLPNLIQGSAEKLPWPDNSFDAIISINTIHNLTEDNCRKAIQEMLRVGKSSKNMFLEVDAYRNEKEKQRMDKWVLTAETMKSTLDWLELYKNTGYDGDYWWFIV